MDLDGEVLDNTTVSGKVDCLNHSEYFWVNSQDNFDNTVKSTWCLFKIGVLFDGYEQFVEDAMDSRQVGAFCPARRVLSAPTRVLSVIIKFHLY